MRRRIIALRPLLSTLPIGVLVLFAGSLAAQQDPVSLQLSLSRPNVATRKFSVTMPVIFDAHQTQAAARQVPTIPAAWFPLGPDNNRVPNLRQFIRTAKLSCDFKQSFPSTTSQSAFSAPYLGSIGSSNANRDLDLTRVPLAGPIILKVTQESDAHPRLTRFFKIIRPEF